MPYVSPPGRPPAEELILTLFGDYLLERPERVWVGHLIELLETLGVTPGATRTALSRMGRKGRLETAREGRLSYYALTAKGRRLLEQGRERILHPPRDESWDGRWTVITYSVPEVRRDIRDRLRVRLAWLGCGSVANGVWISPHDVAAPVEATARSLELGEGLHLFRGEFRGPDTAEEMVARCWDLAVVNRAYREFVGRHGPSLERSRAELTRFGRLCPAESFLLRFRLIHEYRQFPFLDPYLPSRFLPEGWAGKEAAALFRELHGLLAGPAEEHVEWVLEKGGGR